MSAVFPDHWAVQPGTTCPPLQIVMNLLAFETIIRVSCLLCAEWILRMSDVCLPKEMMFGKLYDWGAYETGSSRKTSVVLSEEDPQEPCVDIQVIDWMKAAKCPEAWYICVVMGACRHMAA